MHVSNSVFTETSFWVMVVVSVVLPFGIYGVLIAKQAISRKTVLVLGFSLVAIAAVDVFFLQRLATVAAATPSLADDVLFVSELRVALYLLPALFAGLGINVISHVLTTHLAAAEKRFAEQQADESTSEV
jgi:O-antigen ligase